MSTLRDLIVGYARDALYEQDENGAMPAGHNGPYLHPERPLRNTCHWMITWCHAHDWTSDTAFLEAAKRALQYALRPEHRPGNANWWQRTMRNRDRCNGTIGAAWIIEGLTCAHRFLDSSTALDSAAAVFDLHPFDYQNGLWQRVEVDGRLLPFDRTFNHQLWFAASAARLGKSGHQLAWDRALVFLDRLDRNFSVHGSGMVRHRIPFNWYDRFVEPGTLVHNLYVQYDRWRCKSRRPLDARKRDVGYHAFNMHAFAVLKRLIPDHRFWSSLDFVSAIRFSLSDDHLSGVCDSNQYAFPYNPIGFEMAMCIEAFAPDNSALIESWLGHQFAVLSGEECGSYGNDADDPHTARARLYEAVELSESSLELELPSRGAQPS